MTLVERGEELRTLNRLYADCARSHGQVALISGTVASGKTELLRTFTEHLTAKGALVLTATGSRAEHARPFGVLRQLLHGLSLPEAPDKGAVVLENLCVALTAVARRKPVVIGVDDVHFADAPSLQALLYLQRRTRYARVMIILTEWALPRPARAVFRAEVTRQPNTTLLRLAALSPRGVEDLLRTRLDPLTARALTPAYHAVSGGNPLLVGALVDDYRSAGGRAKEPVIGRAYAEAVTACLHRWEPALLEVARGLALLGAAGTPALIGKLLDLSAETVAQLLDVLTAAGLLDSGRFRHPVARSAVLGSLAPADRATRHRRAAILLHHDGAAKADVAEHLIAGDHPAEPWAIQVLREAAEEAVAADRVDLAVARLELAARSCVDDAERASVLTQLLRVEWRVDPAAARRHVSPLLDARARGTLADADAVHLAKFLFWYGETEDLAGTLAGLAKRANPAVEWLSFLNPTAGIAAAPPLDWIMGGSAEFLLRGGDHVLSAQFAALAGLIHTDRTDRAAASCAAMLAEARAQRATTRQAVLGALLGEISLRQGELTAALEYATVADELLSPQGWGVAIGLPLAVRIVAATAMGDHQPVAALLRRPVPDAVFDTQFGVRYLQARGLHYLATDRPRAALGEFQRCGELMTGWSLDLPGLVPWRVDAARALLALGDRDAAHEAITTHLALPTGHGARSRGVGLRVLAAAADADARVALLTESVGLLGGDRYELARALSDLSRAHEAAGERDHARTAARRARQLAVQCHAEPLIRELRAETNPAPSGPAPGSLSVDALSDAERRVAVLAALGHTNREIGGKLYITVSTVEQHLTRVYRKLKVTRRTDLPAGLPRQLLLSPDER
jgi:DNA-binding CsgD family transcriptional regulator